MLADLARNGCPLKVGDDLYSFDRIQADRMTACSHEEIGFVQSCLVPLLFSSPPCMKMKTRIPAQGLTETEPGRQLE